MLQAENIKKAYGKKTIVKGISFSLQKGESFGLLGPNGAGKSTTISMISGLVPHDSGRITVGGYVIGKETAKAKQKIGVVPQEIALYPTLTAIENLMFWGKMYGLSHGEAKKRSAEVLEYVGLTERAKDKIETFSGGMKRRINIGAALMHKPELLIMDEPTVGIDPQSRNHILETVKQLNETGMTVIYTSHYMEEVEYLCDRIGIIDRGEMIAIGTKTDLCSRLGGDTIIQLTVSGMDEAFLFAIRSLAHVNNVTVQESELKIDISAARHEKVVTSLLAEAAAHHINLLSLQVQEPNLERLFLNLTGRTLRD
ncbi:MULTISPECIES: linearmycin resistance ATP-binding protein LnrL [unclassified Bacillus (in: firmicutes)]|uniref:linearmycin resistance ATP-binding protein LnrL n=1 Tax=unclassified Bacillus (in: firmicutes) TaxID=185979 RepID=UPI00227FA4D2|nr:linearmycin resistance ATP-binding protein LnrL [Bacillus sp. S20C3]MCY8203600.1 linearmycin resistance ATP-binding protein LnrL [Bacillus sp. N12A5]MCY8289705.1 linearmycin resistance ATP-binding protein LnrL [Bacillus sp. N13C7]MCY8639493.1 linearmycin resistance ATP-binding protein LnrL [Bacillus sp. S17B2]MCY8720203.1 linearmycin resistance ATP-binding protein LnrL [Bacillus sp. S10C12M]MCY9144895.1 linearmycin resistance ATP-binding protein LnrL [Bacillus sp. T9C1]